MKKTAFKTVSQKTLAYSLAFTLAACPLASAGHVLAAPAAASADSVEAAQAHAQAQVAYRIDARLDEKNMHIQGRETVTYRNTSKDTLRKIVFHTFADANRSKAAQTSMFEQNNEEIRKENP